jgi:hypothetical protein
MYCVLPPTVVAEGAYSKLDEAMLARGSKAGPWGPDRAASDAVRDPECSLCAGLWRRSCCSCAVYSGPRYCDRRTVLRFS